MFALFSHICFCAAMRPLQCHMHNILTCMISLLRTATQAYMVNREGLVYARGYLKLAEMLQRLGDVRGWAGAFAFLFQPFRFLSVRFAILSFCVCTAGMEKLLHHTSQTARVVLRFRIFSFQMMFVPHRFVEITMRPWPFTQALGHMLKQMRETRDTAWDVWVPTCQVKHRVSLEGNHIDKSLQLWWSDLTCGPLHFKAPMFATNIAFTMKIQCNGWSELWTNQQSYIYSTCMHAYCTMDQGSQGWW